MTKVDKLPTDLEGMEASMERVHSLIEDVYKYVDDVVEGRVAHDNNIGRFILNTLAFVPKMSLAAFDKVLNDKIQDNYALVYLASLTRTQFSIAEKLNTATQILVNMKLPTIEVRYQNLNVEAECEVVQGKSLPTLWNTVKGIFLEDMLCESNKSLGKSNAYRISSKGIKIVSPGTNPQATLMMMGRYMGRKMIEERRRMRNNRRSSVPSDPFP